MIAPDTTEGLREFVVERATGTHADVFAAVGLADVLASAVGRPRVWLIADERGFLVRTDKPVDATALAQLAVGPGYPYLQAKARDAVPAGVVDKIDYEAERERAKRYAAAQRALREAKGKTDALDLATRQSLDEDKPVDAWRQAQVMLMLSNHLAANAVHASLASRSDAERRHEVVEALQSVAEGKRAGVSWKADAVQLFNPTAAKGYARLKPDSTSRNDKTKEQWTSPFVEWLRYRGYFLVACPYFQGSKGEHIRIYTPVPANLSLAQLVAAAQGLREARLWGNGPKLDALAVLWLATFLVQHSEEARSAPAGTGLAALGYSLRNRTPSDVVAGLAITHYQSLGSARAVSTLATLAVPGWFPIASAVDAADWLEILDEHRRVVQGLDDSHSDEIGLLVGYRRFLERRGPAAFAALLAFMGDYGPFIVRAWDAKRRVRAFRTTSFRRLVEGMAPEFSSIVADPGFAAVARAVRRATIQAQFLKANNASDIREIRYDLLPELRRARTVPDSKLFVEVVSDFVSKYNAENARRRELKKPAPANVHTDEFAGFLNLVDAHGAEVVGALLCAYGTCVEPRDAAAASDDAAAEPAAPSPDSPVDDNTQSEG